MDYKILAEQFRAISDNGSVIYIDNIPCGVRALEDAGIVRRSGIDAPMGHVVYTLTLTEKGMEMTQ